MAQYGVVWVTVGSEAQGQAIAQAIVGEGLAACVNLFPVQSIYRWAGAVQQDQEWQLVIKTDLDQFQALSDRVQHLHSYDLPEIIALPITQGLPGYLDWIAEQVQSPGRS
jgi:periplasmic divalent cation tolerance protein